MFCSWESKSGPGGMNTLFLLLSAYRRVHGFGYLLADCPGLGSGTLCSIRVWDSDYVNPLPRNGVRVNRYSVRPSVCLSFCTINHAEFKLTVNRCGASDPATVLTGKVKGQWLWNGREVDCTLAMKPNSSCLRAGNISCIENVVIKP